MSVSDVEKMAKMLKEEKGNLLNEVNDKIKKKKSFTNHGSENELLK
jgi:hypothetical protein